MKRHIAMLLAAAALSATVVAAPASADGPTEVCVAVTGAATVNAGGAGLTYPVTALGPMPPLLLPFGFVTVLGACTTLGLTPGKLAVTAGGAVHGWCGLSTGHGATTHATPRQFAWVGVGGTLVIAGDLVGVVNAAPDPTAPPVPTNSCTDTTLADGDPWGANLFLINGVVVLSLTSA